MEMDSLYQNQKSDSKGRLDCETDTVIYENHGNIEIDSLYQNLNYWTKTYQF